MNHRPIVRKPESTTTVYWSKQCLWVKNSQGPVFMLLTRIATPDGPSIPPSATVLTTLDTVSTLWTKLFKK